MKKFIDSVASSCRYGDVAAEIWGDWYVIWEDSEADYQGYANFVATKDGKFVNYSWSYGSCGGCDDWEARDLSDGEIIDEMERDAIYFDDRETFLRWVEALPANRRFPILANLPKERKVTLIRRENNGKR